MDCTASLVVRIVPPRARYVDPASRIESMRLSVCKVLFRILFCQPSHQTLRCIADDQKWMVILIDKIAAVGAHFERVNRTIALGDKRTHAGLLCFQNYRRKA